MGIVFPSFAIIYLIAILMDDFLEITVIANAFKGIKLAVGILILDAALKMIQKMQRKPIPIVIMVCAATLMMITNIFSLKLSISPIMLIIISVVLGIWGYA